MSGFVGVIVSDPWLQSQLTQVELRTLKSKFVSVRTQSGRVTTPDLSPLFAKLKAFSEMFTEDEIMGVIEETCKDLIEEIDFESFLRAHLSLQNRAAEKSGGSKSSSSFLKTTTTTVHHTINEFEKASYVSHINSFLAEDPFLKKYLPLDPSTIAFCQVHLLGPREPRADGPDPSLPLVGLLNHLLQLVKALGLVEVAGLDLVGAALVGDSVEVLWQRHVPEDLCILVLGVGGEREREVGGDAAEAEQRHVAEVLAGFGL